jgi:hypothetical protein
MDANTISTLNLFIPGLIAVIGNIIFYLFVKNKIDKSIERHKISYSGIYKEKIEIHKEILKQLFGLRLKTQQYQYFGTQETAAELFTDFNSFISYYLISQPFLKKEILDGLKSLTKELQSCFDDFHMYNSLSGTRIDPKSREEITKKFFDSGNKFKTNQPFGQIEEMLIREMKADLKIDE